ncbi:uncharacterized protein BO88DRAFT_488786 [Aspergillus vadensis CBS 113365]|uniref:Uncharacterized protein n=1 Tax=Aspergillus vadensis (strain CBS 113365 / IMI 142717 / IBT 24658) TaxID=1448311 RepID=A0A319B6A1_ASPVC|nr:hypothetical protein BO88DRAFT_488786 [Aspergillus vadensis CBS 113365]PYH68326.1 hypothetical protein BO88DRAFT_488786 [Aspergillus vadensis CBS 113365]
MAPGVEPSELPEVIPQAKKDSRKTNKETSVHDIHKGEPQSSSTPGSGSGFRQQTSNSPVAVRPDEFDYLHAPRGAFKCALCHQWHTKRCPWLINY